jgi:TonB-linked SusC/RagA family outer membrane protein
VYQYLGKDATSGEDNYALLREGQPLGYQVIDDANRAIATQLVVNYDRSFGDHNLTGMLLYHRRDYVNLNAATSILNLPYREQGFAGRATYNYDNRYLLEFNFGYNGSENFPPGKKYGFFPAISGGWIVSNEKFWNFDLINSLKFRGSYGKVGNDQIGGERFLFLTSINTNANGYFFGDGQVGWRGTSESQIGNNNVTWEVATKTDVGLDLTFLRNKVTLQLDVFDEDRTGILLQRQQVPDYAGFLPTSVQFGNLGRVKNRGLDALIELKNTTQKGLYYSVRANFTYAHNKVIENDEALPKYPYLSGKGHPVGQPWGLIDKGFFGNHNDVAASPVQTFQNQVLPGDIKYTDVNGDGVVDAYGLQPIGYARTPEIIYGFGGTVAYKGFDVSIYFTGAAHTSLFLSGWSMYPFATGLGIFNVMQEYYNHRWTPDQQHPKYPEVTDGNNPNNFQNSTIWQKDASYLRIKNAEIGYTINRSFTKKFGVNSLRAFVNGTNLYTWDKIKVIDPESDNGTGEYPLQLGLNLGLQLTF